MIYAVDVKLYYNVDMGDTFITEFHSVENVVSKKLLPYDKVIEIALKEAIKDLEDIYGVIEECIKYSKASIIGVVDNEYFKD